MKIYGPYKGKDGRLRCVVIYEDGKRKTVSYPRLLMENYLKRNLLPEEDVHHIDGDVLNNDICNLELINHPDHCRKHSIKYTNDIIVSCIYCGKEFTLTPKQQRGLFNRRNEKAGPFCSRSCCGKYGTDVQRAAK